MQAKSIVKLSNTVGLISILLLIYWVFIYISIQVFNLRVFKEILTETFYISILGILSLMAAALIINIMFNLTRIAEKHNNDEIETKKSLKIRTWMILTGFPLIFVFLIIGNYLTDKNKENMLVNSALTIINNNKQNSDKLVNYSFSEEWLIETSEILDMMDKTDKNFPFVSIIVKDEFNKTPVFLRFHKYTGSLNDTIVPQKKNFIISTSESEREYLNKVFENNNKDFHFVSEKGKYELFYPFTKNGRVIVLYFSEYDRYGKIGS